MIEKFTLSRKRIISTRILLAMVCLSCFIISCEDADGDSITHVSGKIVNPKVDYVILTNYAEIRDTLKLDENGNFSISYPEIKSGLYSISYPGEYQSFYLDEGDSLGMRANTKAFDETLAFTGTHAKENTLLIQLFGEIEDSNMRLLQHKNKSPQEFLKYVNDVKRNRLDKLEEAALKFKLTQRFTDFATFIIKLNSYYELERYAIVKDVNPYTDNRITFPDDFFEHRKKLSINEPKLLNNFAFRPFLNALVSNMAFKKMSRESSQEIDLNSYSYNKDRLAIIDSIFSNEDLQNYFATSEIRNFIRGRKDAEDINMLVTDFLKISTDEQVNEEIAEMAATYVNLNPGNSLPNFQLRDVDNKVITLKEELNKLSVLYYWSIADQNYALGIHDQVKELQLKYPEIEFVGINIDKLNYDEWQDVIAEHDFRDSREYQVFAKSAVERQLALRNSNRSMVVDKNLKIIDPNINLFYYRIETTLLGYLNR